MITFHKNHSRCGIFHALFFQVKNLTLFIKLTEFYALIFIYSNKQKCLANTLAVQDSRVDTAIKATWRQDLQSKVLI